MKAKYFLLVSTISSVLFCLSGAAAFADGMPVQAAKPQPILTPLENKQPPVDVKPPAAAPVIEVQKEAVAPPKVEAPPQKAEVPPVPESRVVAVQPDTAFLGLSIGMYDPFAHHEKATAFTLEWQPGVQIVGILQPIFGVMATTQRTVLGYGGLGLPLKFNDHVKLLPSLSLGAYKQGKGVDLGQVAVFRIGAELAYQFDDASKLGLNAYILTNGDSTKRDARTEIISLAYTMPLQPAQEPEQEKQPAPKPQ